MDDNLFNNYINSNYDDENGELNEYIKAGKYIYDDNKIIIPTNNNRYINNIYYRNKNISNFISFDKQNNPLRYHSNYKKKFLYNSYNNEIQESNNYKINNNYNNRNLSKSIKKNEENEAENIMNINDSYKKWTSNYLKMSSNQNVLNNKNLFSAMNPLNKNIKNRIKRMDNDIISNNTDLINNNIINKESIIDKNEFMKNIKEIDDLDNIDIIPDDFNNNLILKNNNINNISVNKNMNLNKLNTKENNNYIKNASEKKNINNYNRVNLQNKISNNILMKQKNINTEKKGNIRYSKKLSDNIKKNNLSDNKNIIKEKKDLIDLGYNNEQKLKNINNYENRYNNHNNLLIQNNYKTYIKLEDKNNNFIKLRNSNYAMIGKKFSEKLNISPSQKRFSTLTNNKQEENFNLMNDDYDFSDIYKQLINLKNANIQLRKNIDFLKKTVHKKDSIIKKLYTDNEKLKRFYQKMKANNEEKQKINKDLLSKINSYKNEILLLKNKVKYNLENNKLIHQYEYENNNLKKLLNKSKERQYSTDISKNNILNSFINYEDISKDYSNYKEYNKSVSFTKSKTRINIPIFKEYQEDKEKDEINPFTEKNILNNDKI